MGTDSKSEPAADTAAVEERRRGIDRIDRTIVALLAERLRLGCEIGDLKRELDLPGRSPEREAEVLDRVRAAAGLRLPRHSAERIFSVIIAETAAAQETEKTHE